MLVKTKAIVISSLKYQEKSLIVKCFTASDGLKSYFVHNAFTGKNNRQKSSYFQPLNLLEIEAVHKNKGTLENFKEIRFFSPYHNINTDVYKSTIAIFLSEVLHYCLHENDANPPFYQYLETAFLWLDNHDETANFHLILLAEMTKFLGFFPDTSEGNFFEMTEGFFTERESLTCLSAEESLLFKKLLEIKFDNPLVFSVKQRRLLLKILMDYYSLHIESFRHPKSLEVLTEVFS
ncbi:DNA repair protein RecO [Flavobacterium sp. NST-5]|uniref:DNA repair protein RecO n=1 Tax=Flavobacterium ichthyis TaxID=2698827 RepID=A0ABW9ZDS7_9FLAO|nr:DNA repair protein RecO [Flavobacterium ichthyis]NBL65457.1 DNA repair protein RecO [Flavobacterium ichthyis]